MRLDDAGLPAYLARRGLITQPEAALVEPAGDGNINWVRRVRTPTGESLIVKQARAALEKFPEYQVSPRRIGFEHAYVRTVQELAPDHARVMVGILDFDEPAHVLVLEDLGTRRLAEALASNTESELALRELGAFLGAVHAASAPECRALTTRFTNDEMRSLHGEHIYTLPFEGEGFPVSPSVRRRASRALDRPGVRGAIAELRAEYYGRREALVHADPQPGNVLLQGDRARLLDAEIAHIGDPAFDLGSLLGHLVAFACATGDEARAHTRAGLIEDGYRSGGGQDDAIARAWRHAGVELLRRTLGAARLGMLESDPAGCAAIDRGVALAVRGRPFGV